MKLATSTVRDDAGDPWFEVKFHDLTDAQIDLAFDLVEAQFRKIYVPLPVCGGDLDRDEGWAWVMFDGFTVSIQDGEVSAHFELAPEGEDRMDPTHDHWVQPRETLWIEAIPFVREFGRKFAEVH